MAILVKALAPVHAQDAILGQDEQRAAKQHAQYEDGAEGNQDAIPARGATLLTILRRRTGRRRNTVQRRLHTLDDLQSPPSLRT